jgi:hypothetical protein
VHPILDACAVGSHRHRQRARGETDHRPRSRFRLAPPRRAAPACAGGRRHGRARAPVLPTGAGRWSPEIVSAVRCGAVRPGHAVCPQPVSSTGPPDNLLYCAGPPPFDEARSRWCFHWIQIFQAVPARLHFFFEASAHHIFISTKGSLYQNSEGTTARPNTLAATLFGPARPSDHVKADSNLNCAHPHTAAETPSFFFLKKKLEAPRIGRSISMLQFQNRKAIEEQQPPSSEMVQQCDRLSLNPNL